jgi:methylphosphotriester-DNA--protein-cysteine methyltransferase
MNKTSITEFGGLDLTIPTIPLRSRLYHLKPINVGTSYVESLTSYFCRLASAHCVSTASLYQLELDPRLQKIQAGESQSQLSHKTSRYSLIYSARPVNGPSATAKAWVHALEELTLRRDLRFLTALPWGSAVSFQALLRQSRAWCPRCYEDWRREDEVIYEPLIWMFDSITICLYHKQRLEKVCPYCKRIPQFITGNSRLGYCSRCQNWLGASENVETLSLINLSPEEQDYQIWLANTLEEWIRVAQVLPFPPTRESVTRTISNCINNIVGGNAQAFARLVGVDTVYGWQTGECIPAFDCLLRICFVIGVSLTEFLTNQQLFDKAFRCNERFDAHLQEILATSMRNQHNVREVLEAALMEEPPPSLNEMAERLGYKNKSSLREIFPELCKKITENYRLSESAQNKPPTSRKKICDDATIQQALELALELECPPTLKDIALNLSYKHLKPLHRRFPKLCRLIVSKRAEYKKLKQLAEIKPKLEAALEEDPPPSLKVLTTRLGFKNTDGITKAFPDLCRAIVTRYQGLRKVRLKEIRSNLRAALKENPPPTMKHIAERYGYNEADLYRHFQKLCHPISARYAAYQRENAINRRELFKAQVREIAVELSENGIHPSEEQVRPLLVNPVLRSWVVLNQVLREIRRELKLPDRDPKSLYSKL